MHTDCAMKYIDNESTSLCLERYYYTTSSPEASVSHVPDHATHIRLDQKEASGQPSSHTKHLSVLLLLVLLIVTVFMRLVTCRHIQSCG